MSIRPGFEDDGKTFPRAEYDAVDITITAGKDNYDSDNFNGGWGGTGIYGFGVGVSILDTGALAENALSLKINEGLNVRIEPNAVLGSKPDTMRRGVSLNGGVVSVGGDAEIYIKNYIHAESDSNLGEYEDFGMGAQQGIWIDGEDSKMTIGGNLGITSLNGNRSMGLYASRGELTVGGDTTITVKDATYYNYGISNFYGDQAYDFRYSAADPRLVFNGDLDITVVGGNNSVGINLKDDSYNSDGKNTITVTGHLSIDASGAEEYTEKTDLQRFPNSVSNYGMYMYNIAGSSFNTATIKTTSVGEGVESIGSYAYWNSNIDFNGDVQYITSAEDKSVEISALARAGSTITFNKGLTAVGAVVLNAVGNTYNNGSVISVNPSADAGAKVRLTGNIVAGKTTSAYIFGSQYDTFIDNAETQNIITANLLNSDSYFTGVNEFGNEGSIISLTFRNGASWNMTGSSPVTDLVLADGGQADMTYNNDYAASGFRNLTATSLSGDGGVIRMNIDAGKANNSDRVYVTGTHTGEHYIFLNNVNSASFSDGAEGTVLVSVGKEEGKFSAPSTEGKLYWNRYELGDKESATDGYETDWYLKNVVQEETGGSDNKPTTSVEAGFSANALGYHTWRTEMDSLMQRMGDLRQEDEPDNGAWFRVKGGKINRDGAFGFENEYVMYQLGYDDVLKRTDKYTSYIGVAFSYTDGEGSYYRGDGENEGKEFGLYYTKVHDNGHYLDVAVKAGRWDNDFDATDRSGNRISGDYDNNSFAFSAEYGRKIGMGAKGWYIEPQAQLSWGYFSGADYKMSNGVSVHQSGISSLLGRVGFNIGRDINKYSNIYLKANLYHEFCGDYTVSMDDGAGNSYQRSDAFDDTWFEYGVGAAFKWGEDARFYIDAERSAGSDFEKEWTVNAGFAWTF